MSSDVTHHAVDEFHEYRNVVETVTPTSIVQGVQQVTHLPQHFVPIQLSEKALETGSVLIGWTR